MIILVIGMSKSGTTLCAKTLHHSGFNMNPIQTGGYAKSKYECQDAIRILKQMIGVKKLQSLYLPEKINFNEKIEKQIKSYIKKRNSIKNWGIKQPYLTLCYDIWRKYLPDHKVIAMKRQPEGLLSHYAKHGKNKLSKKIKNKIITVQKTYNNLIDSYNVPIIWFEDFLRKGSDVIKDIIGKKLIDVRDNKPRHKI